MFGEEIPIDGRARTGTMLVTGAAGFIGSNLVDALLTAGHRVIGVDCFTDYYSPARKQMNLADAMRRRPFTLIRADLDVCDLDAMLDGVDAVFHLAAQPGVRGSWGVNFETYAHRNLIVTQRLLEALARHPVPTVMASTSSVYGENAGAAITDDAPLHPVSPYGMTKAAAEQLIAVYRRDRGLPVVCLRYFTVYGPRQRPDMAFARFIESMENGDVLEVFGTGEQIRDFTFVDDVVRATIAAAGAPSPVYNIGGGNPVSLADTVELLQHISGVEARLVYRATARGDVLRTWADTSLARAELGWAPQTSLETGLAAQVAQYRQTSGSHTLAV